MKANSEAELIAIGKNLAEQLKSSPDFTTPLLIELVGDVGAGKTTFTRGLAAGLGLTTPVTSPSFTISKSYATPAGFLLTHYDFYRLSDPGLMATDLAEKLSAPSSIIVVEWGGSVANLLPPSRITVKISKNDDDTRTVTISYPSHLITNNASPIPPAIKAPKSTDLHPLYLDTSTPETYLRLGSREYRAPLNHSLAEKILSFIKSALDSQNLTWHDLTSLTFMTGPGSFTGLRIGAAVVNTLAHELQIPLYTHHGEKVPIIIPDYGHPANITSPVK